MNIADLLGDVNSALVKSPAMWKTLLIALAVMMGLRTLFGFRRRRQQPGRRIG